MADNAPIIVADNVPANHTLSPVAIKDGSVATYQDLSIAVPSARDKFAVQMKESAVVRTVTADLRIMRAVTETVNGVAITKVVDFGTIKTTLIAPKDWSAAQCANARVMGANALKSAVVTAAFDNAEFVW